MTVLSIIVSLCSTLYYFALLGCFVYSICALSRQKRMTAEAQEDFFNEARLYIEQERQY